MYGNNKGEMLALKALAEQTGALFENPSDFTLSHSLTISKLIYCMRMGLFESKQFKQNDSMRTFFDSICNRQSENQPDINAVITSLQTLEKLQKLANLSSIRADDWSHVAESQSEKHPIPSEPEDYAPNPDDSGGKKSIGSKFKG